MLGLVSVIAITYQYLLCDVYLGRINSEFCYDNVIIMVWAAMLFIKFRESNYSEQCGKRIVFVSANTFGVFLLHQYFVDYFNLTEMINSVIGGFVLWAVISVGCFILSVLIGQTPIIKEALKY